MRRGLGRGPKLPGVHVWFERIDSTAYAVFACRQWTEAPRLTVWKIITADQGVGWDCQWRGIGLRLLEATEARLAETCGASYYVRLQRMFAEYGTITLIDMARWTGTRVGDR